MNRKKFTLKMCIAAMSIALGIILPLITNQIPQIGNSLCPMHIPVLICGFLCGPFWGFFVGMVLPPFRFLIFTAPKFPLFIAMSMELASYGFFAGLLYRLLPKKISFTYISLILSMILGRVVWALGRFLLQIIFEVTFSFEIFLASGFVTALPGIIIQIIIIPPIVLALRKNKFLFE